MTLRSPELLAPAGSLTMLETALRFGADAVYAGQPRYSLRVRNNEFSTLTSLAQGIAITHAANKKFFLVSNIYPHGAKLKTFLADITPIIALGPDALIMSDPGLIMLVREHFPEQTIHLSVQANTVNSAAVKFWQNAGIARVILSRELSLEEISDIRQACPDIELEVFVHGALCIAYSGRCLLSGYFNHRDPNQGACTNACRWDYKVREGHCDDGNKVHFIENQRSGERNEIEEDEHGSYILNSKDLRAVEYVDRLSQIGVDSLKIEGRTKSSYYVARTTQVYRQAIDDAAHGRQLNPQLISQLEELANRGYTNGFLERHVPHETQNYLAGYSSSERSQYAADIIGWDNSQQLALLEIKNRIRCGDQLELILPEGNIKVSASELRNQRGELIDAAPGSGIKVWLKLPPRTNGYAHGFVVRALAPSEATAL